MKKRMTSAFATAINSSMDRAMIEMMLLIPGWTTAQMYAIYQRAGYAGTEDSLRRRLNRLKHGGIMGMMTMDGRGSVYQGIWHLTPAARDAAMEYLGIDRPLAWACPTTPTGAAVAHAATSLAEMIAEATRRGLHITANPPPDKLDWPGWGESRKPGRVPRYAPAMIWVTIGINQWRYVVDFGRTRNRIDSRRLDLYGRLTGVQGMVVVAWDAVAMDYTAQRSGQSMTISLRDPQGAIDSLVAMAEDLDRRLAERERNVQAACRMNDVNDQRRAEERGEAQRAYEQALAKYQSEQAAYQRLMRDWEGACQRWIESRPSEIVRSSLAVALGRKRSQQDVDRLRTEYESRNPRPVPPVKPQPLK